MWQRAGRWACERSRNGQTRFKIMVPNGFTTLNNRRSYLDHNATTPLHPQARDAMIAAFEVAGNPSSVHAEGRAARALIDMARRHVVAMTGAAEVVFTSGGTEALNIALDPAVAAWRERGSGRVRLLVGAGEHPAVLNGHRFGVAAETVALTRDGVLDLDDLGRRVGGEPVVLALQAANNETGVVQPVRDAAALVHAAGGYVVCDAVQAAGKIGCELSDFDADALAVSAHKFGGAKGVGALCFGDRRHHLEYGAVRGGGQERGLRGGTENVSGIAGLGAACKAAEHRRRGQAETHAHWRDAIEMMVQALVPEAVIFGIGSCRLPNTSCFALPGIDAQVLLMNLDLEGVAVSAGSACAAGRISPSHVLGAMGVAPAIAIRALRVSLGWTTTERDIEVFTQALDKAVRTMRTRSRQAA